MVKLSLFIITYNEEKNLRLCLESASSICDEIIVVDSLSSDGTKQIAESFNAKFYTRKFDGFAAQKSYALSKCSGEWALSLDADEFINAELAQAIKQTIESDNKEINGYNLLRINYFLGRCMKYSGLKNENILRLVRRNKAKYIGGLVHEKIEVDGKICQLKDGHIQHYSYSSIHDYFEKFNKYTSLGAEKKASESCKPKIFLSLMRIPFDFLRRYIFQLGFMDGVQGFIWCAFSAFYPFVKYMKLWEIVSGAAKK